MPLRWRRRAVRVSPDHRNVARLAGRLHAAVKTVQNVATAR